MSKDEADQMYFLNNKSKNMVKVTLTSNPSIRKFPNFISCYYYFVIFNYDEPTIVMHASKVLWHELKNEKSHVWAAAGVTLNNLLKVFYLNMERLEFLLTFIHGLLTTPK